MRALGDKSGLVTAQRLSPQSHLPQRQQNSEICFPAACRPRTICAMGAGMLGNSSNNPSDPNTVRNVRIGPTSSSLHKAGSENSGRVERYAKNNSFIFIGLAAMKVSRD